MKTPQEIAEEIRDSFGFENPVEICNGYCAEFAKKMFEELRLNGYESEIVVNSVFELEDELEGYDTINSEYDRGEYSHCYIKCEDEFFDALDVQGVSREDEMEYEDAIYEWENN